LIQKKPGFSRSQKFVRFPNTGAGSSPVLFG